MPTRNSPHDIIEADGVELDSYRTLWAWLFPPLLKRAYYYARFQLHSFILGVHQSSFAWFIVKNNPLFFTFCFYDGCLWLIGRLAVQLLIRSACQSILSQDAEPWWVHPSMNECECHWLKALGRTKKHLYECVCVNYWLNKVETLYMRRSPITLYETLVRPNICYLKNKLFWFPDLSFNLPTFVLIGCSWQRETRVSDVRML